MKQLKITALASLVGLVVLGVGLFAASRASAASGTIKAGSATASIGTEIAVDIDALSMTAPGLGAWSINITYNPAIVTPNDCSGATQACNLAFNATTIRLAGANGGGLEGDNTLATITFRCDAAGTSALGLSLITLADATPARPTNIDPATVVNGSVACVTQVAGAGTVIKIGSASAAVGGRAAVELQSLNVPEPGLGAWTVDVAYDPDVVHTVSCTAGSAGLSVCNPDFSDTTFRVTGANIDGLPGDNTLAAITFECDAVDSSALHITVQVLADATVGQPQTIVPTTTDGTIACTTVAAAPTNTPVVPVLPPAGSGGGIGFDAGNPLSWLIAGLIGAGLAWLASGLASARFATVASSRSTTAPTAPSRPPVAPERLQERPTRSLPRTMPTWRRRQVDLGSPPDKVEPDWFRRSK